MIHKRVLWVLIFLMTLCYSNNSIATAKNVVQNGEEVLDMIKAGGIDFQAIIAYIDTLETYNLSDEVLSFNLEVIDKATNLYGEGSIVTKISYLLLARHYAFQGNLEVSQAILDYVVETTNNKDNKSSHGYGFLWNRILAGCFSVEGKHQEALAINKRLLASMKGGDDYVRVSLMNQMAYNLNMIGSYKESIFYTKKARAIEKRDDYKEAKDLVVDTFLNFSKTYTLQGNYKDSLFVIEGLVFLYREQNVAYFPELRHLYAQYSTLLGIRGDLDAIKKAAKKSIDIQNKLQIDNDDKSLFCYNNMAFVEKEQKHYAKAKELFLKSLKIIKQISLPKKTKEEILDFIHTSLAEIENKN